MFLLKILFPIQTKHNNLLKEYARQRGVQAGTILRELGTLKAAIHYAEGNRWIERQPQFIMPVKSPPPRDVWLKREEVALLIEKAKSPHMRLFIKIAVSTAARSGAILDLKWNQLDFDQRLIDFGQGHGRKRRSIVYPDSAITRKKACVEIRDRFLCRNDTRRISRRRKSEGFDRVGSGRVNRASAGAPCKCARAFG